MSIIASQTIDSAVWEQSAKEMYKLPVANIEFAGENDSKDTISSFTLTAEKKEVSVYHLKLMHITSKEISNAVVSADGNYLIGYKVTDRPTAEGRVKEKELEVWNLKPVKPSFLGMKIDNLFDFFMIFVYMAGAAAILLFAINKWLLKMMHGVV